MGPFFWFYIIISMKACDKQVIKLYHFIRLSTSHSSHVPPLRISRPWAYYPLEIAGQFALHTHGDNLVLKNIAIKPATKPTLVTLDTIEPREIKWLWHPYIPTGTVTAVFGQGGQGKTYLTCDIAARLSRGEALPDNPSPAGPQRVLMLSAEDDYATVLVPRLIKLGARLENIAVPSVQFTLDGAGGDNVRDLMREFAATVVFIDPIVYYAGGKMDMNRSNEVRAMMEKLKGAAEQADSSVIIVGHVRKSEEGGDQNRMMGSADWVNAARSGLLVSTTNDGTKVMHHVKTNYGERGLVRAFEIDNDGFHWTETFGEDDLPTAATIRSRPRSQAESFLKNLLANGPVAAKEVEARAADEEIAPATLNRAKTGIAESYFSKSQGWMWRLLSDRPVIDRGQGFGE